MDETYRLVYESVDQDIFGEFMITPLTHGAVASHPNLPLAKSPCLTLKRRGYKTKGEALAGPNVIREIRRLWYDVERFDERAILPDVASYA